MAEYAFTTLEGLRTAVREYLARRDITDAQVDSFLGIGSRRVFRRLRVRQNERVYEVSSSARSLTLPEDYLAAKTLTCEGAPLERVSDIRILQLAARNHSGTPEQFGRSGNALLLYPAPSEERAFALTYWADLSGIAEPDDVLLTLCPELWLYGALVEASMFLRKSKSPSEWDGLFERALEEVNNVTDEESRSGFVTQVEIGL